MSTEWVPAFDLRVYNPIHWPRKASAEVAALGRLDLLPPEIRADRVVRHRDPFRLRRHHHVEDVQAFHADALTRACDLVRLAATGVVVHLADADHRLQALLGDELHGLMTTDAGALDAGARELHGIRMRRAAMRSHSSWARDPEKLPLVSILLATRRPALLSQALAAVADQTWPRLELVLALHGNEESFADAFAGVTQRLAALRCADRRVEVVRVSGSLPFGAVLNTAVAASSGELLTKMDDDDCYGPDHVWDLALAHEYSRAQLVGKGIEFVYLAASDRTVHQHGGGGESWRTNTVAGGAMLIARRDLDKVGGWRNKPRGVDLALRQDVLRSGGSVFRTHGAGYLLVRHGNHHTWEESDDRFLARAARVVPGWVPALADIIDQPLATRAKKCGEFRKQTTTPSRQTPTGSS